jgi:hypothetical protein
VNSNLRGKVQYKQLDVFMWFLKRQKLEDKYIQGVRMIWKLKNWQEENVMYFKLKFIEGSSLLSNY